MTIHRGGPSGTPKCESTEGPKSERRLARSLGYPPTWHVVRTVPHPADDPSSSIVLSGRSCQDRIFAGDPRKHADCYFNHNAAMEAAIEWVEGESTPYDDEGGQLLPRVPKFAKDDEVEVWFEDAWYPATILRVKQCPDDIKYSVLYTEEDTHQHGVIEADVRPAPPKKKKKPAKAKKKPAKAAAAAPASQSAGTKRKAEDEAAVEMDPEQLRAAEEMGLPDGWAVKHNKNYKVSIFSPDRKRFTSKKAAFHHAGLEMPPPGKAGSASGKKNKNTKKGSQSKKASKSGKASATGAKSTLAATVDSHIEEGDPPWRTGGHEYLGNRVRYSVQHGSSAHLQMGTVTGWIAETDVDSAGEPGFVSERTGKPATLFHVTFDRPSKKGQGGPTWLESQDFEEYELKELFTDEDEEDSDNSEDDSSSEDEEEESSSSEDEVPLSAMAKKKEVGGKESPKKKKSKTSK